jgi:uncharacterized protein (TIGR03435 family)
MSGSFIGAKVNMAEFTRVLSSLMGRTVIDKTGFTETFDVQLTFKPDEVLGGVSDSSGRAFSAEASDPNLTNIFTALEEQLGLKLESARGPVEVIVIESIERPTEN